MSFYDYVKNQEGCHPPALDSGSKAHLHHIGQCENSPLAILADSVHDKFTKLLHPDPWSDIDRGKCSGIRNLIYIELSKQI
ncbi:HNH/ENDO VII family nuclease [Succinimonas sp.]|uniref:HNH/ENDO VII family nuclease n=1 Tax=Succinimonas sp. TaxID=1936151 RepID=UPI00386E3BA0